MIAENICKFISEQPSESLQTLHLVWEKKQQNTAMKIIDVYRLHLVMSGAGVLCTEKGEYALEKGDVFFVLPNCLHSIRSKGGFEYAYVGYFGTRATALAEQFSLDESHCVFKGFPELIPFWDVAIRHSAGEYVGLRAEGVLLYTLSVIGERIQRNYADVRTVSAAERVQKYIDEHYTEADMTLRRVCADLSYSSKYISSVFRRQYKITFGEYVRVKRINHACALIERGYTEVQTVAFLSGFSDALYFSKVFKGKMGVSPREYMREIH